jgi:DNA polymerase III delta prime subunit
MQELVEKILKEYPTARATTQFAGEHEMRRAFRELKEQVENVDVVKKNPNLLVHFSIGQGNWSITPFLAILDRRNTKSTQRGTYVVFIFRANGEALDLKLGQGVHEVKEEFGRRAGEILLQRAEAARGLFPELRGTQFEADANLNYERGNSRSQLYDASTIFAKHYPVDRIPNDETLVSDIEVLLGCLTTYLNREPTFEAPNIAETTYSYTDALEDLFLSQEDLKKFIETASRKKNIILQGPPGVGKTFVSRRLASLLMGERDQSRMEFVQFHQSYSYEDFVQGWRPNSNAGFRLRNGVFYEFCKKAREDQGRSYVFIIDEINRGNLSKIFGELLMLIESDKRGDGNAISLTYSENIQDRFSVPENVYIIGLMNTADRSLAMVDYALRRRFAFFSLKPEFNSDQFRNVIVSAGGSDALVERIRARIGHLNQTISGERRDLGPGFQIGHSYFCPSESIENEAEWYSNLIETEIQPLIQEYWFDDQDKVDALIDQLHQ